MKDSNTKPEKKSKEDFMFWGLAIVWVTLFWEGRRIFPWVKRLSESIQEWIIVLNLLFLVIFTILLLSKRSIKRPCQLGIIIMLIVFLLSWILASVGYNNFPLISAMIGFAVLLSWILASTIGYHKYSLKFSKVFSGFLFSWILASLGHHKYPLISSIVGCGVILFILAWKRIKQEPKKGLY